MRMALCLVAFLGAAAAAGDEGLDRIVERLDASEAAERESAQADLDLWCEARGAGAAEQLRARLEGASPRARVRLEDEIAWLDGSRSVVASSRSSMFLACQASRTRNS